MTTDGSTGRRDGFNRWVASMKTGPMETKAAPVKPAVGKLELELDDNATHVHRIPKELISRMREREQPPAAPEPEEESSDEDDDERRGISPLGMVQEDRTAVFRPPPELLARAKRLKSQPKPDAQASVPTKPPPASQAELLQSMPASPKLPAFEGVAAAAKGGFSSVPVRTPLSASGSARMPAPAVARAAAPLPALEKKAPAAAAVLDFSEPIAENAPPASAPAPDSSAVFAKREPASGVLPVAPEPPAVADDDNDEPQTREYSLPELGLPEPRRSAQSAALAETPVASAETAEAETAFSEPLAPPAEPESPFAFEPSSVVPIVPPEVDVAGPAPVEEPEAEQPPTTHAPVVHAGASPAAQPSSSVGLRVLLFVVAVAAAAAYAWWRTRHF